MSQKVIDGVNPEAMVWLMDAVVNFIPSITYVAAGMKFNTVVPDGKSFTFAATGSLGHTLKASQTSQFKVSVEDE